MKKNPKRMKNVNKRDKLRFYCPVRKTFHKLLGMSINFMPFFSFPFSITAFPNLKLSSLSLLSFFVGGQG
jgi:hypothetical protein